MPFHDKDDFTVTRLDPVNWMLEHPIRWEGHDGDHVDIEAGFVTDFATVPWAVQWLIPRTGTWTLPATGHDKLCTLLNRRYGLVTLAYRNATKIAHDGGPCSSCWAQAQLSVPPCTFGPVDTDGAFRAMCEDECVDPIRRWLLWVGVRWGALKNPARRVGWWRTAHLVLPISAVVAAPIVGLLYVLVRGIVAVFGG